MSDDDERATTRRQLLGRAAALGGLAAAGSLSAAGSALATIPRDAELLMPVLGTELLAVIAYKTILHSNLMSEAAQRSATRMLSQEHTHVATFTGALQRMGATPPQNLRTVAEADTVLAAHRIPNRLGHLRTERDCLTILVRVENVLSSVYYHAILNLSDPHLIQLGAQVLASEGQHACVLNLLLRPHDIIRAVPSAYVQ